MVDGDRVQEVEIYLKFIGHFEIPAPELTEEEIQRQEFLKKERTRSRERYQKLKSGERTVGVPITQTCKCCGKTFEARSTAKLFCDVKCRAKYYRQEAAKERLSVSTAARCLPRHETASNTALMISGMRRRSSGRASGRKSCGKQRNITMGLLEALLLMASWKETLDFLRKYDYSRNAKFESKHH